MDKNTGIISDNNQKKFIETYKTKDFDKEKFVNFCLQNKDLIKDFYKKVEFLGGRSSEEEPSLFQFLWEIGHDDSFVLLHFEDFVKTFDEGLLD